MDWKDERRKVTFSDEKRFNLDGPDGMKYYWHDLRTEKQFFSRRRFGGGSVMVWDDMGFRGETDLVFIEGYMNAQSYKTFLAEQLDAHGETISGSGFIFQQDNAGVHTARLLKFFFEETGIHL